jgi:hypothetical protein
MQELDDTQGLDDAEGPDHGVGVNHGESPKIFVNITARVTRSQSYDSSYNATAPALYIVTTRGQFFVHFFRGKFRRIYIYILLPKLINL